MSTLRHEIIGGASPTLADVEAFAVRWHESERQAWDRNGYTAPHMQHDAYNPKSVKDRGRVWFAVDTGTSGRYLVRKADGQVFTIEAYGRPNYRYPQGHVTILYREASHA